MPTPPKPVKLLMVEGKSHRTKKELKQRAEGEAETITGVKMQPWKTLNAEAKKEFARIQDLLSRIEKDDALYENIINRYCELKVECNSYTKLINRLGKDLDELSKEYKANDDMDFMSYLSVKDSIIGKIVSIDRQLQAKRKMMLDIEKESIMTLASALRSIPKKVKEESTAKSGMAKYTRR